MEKDRDERLALSSHFHKVGNRFDASKPSLPLHCVLTNGNGAVNRHPVNRIVKFGINLPGWLAGWLSFTPLCRGNEETKWRPPMAANGFRILREILLSEFFFEAARRTIIGA